MLITKVFYSSTGAPSGFPLRRQRHPGLTSEAGEHRTVDNQLEYKWDVNGSHLVDYSLRTPMYLDDATFLMTGSYQKDMVHGYQIVK